MNKITICLEGLDCANCALKIEKDANSLDMITSAKLNFVTKKLIIDSESTVSKNQLLSIVKKIVHKYEPDVNVTLESRDLLNNSTIPINLWLLPTIGVLIFVINILFSFSNNINILLYVTSYILIGGNVLHKAGRNILNKQIFDENFLMTIATIGAFAIGEYPEAIAVMLFYKIGEFFQSIAVNRSRNSITSLMNLRPDYANIIIDNTITKVDPVNVLVDDIIIVNPGERIPLDGVVIEGTSNIDTSVLTGESLPQKVTVNNDVLSGSINTESILKIKVTKTFGDSTISKILDLVENATLNKSKAESSITKFAKLYTPIVVFSALALAVLPPLLTSSEFGPWIYRALVFLVISCPCALVVSVPLSIFAGIGSASRNGVLVKGGNYLEALTNVDTVIFDKTGTLTEGVFEVTDIVCHNDFSKEELVKYAAYAENNSNHPIAQSIKLQYLSPVKLEQITSYEEIAGHGIIATIDGRRIIVGNYTLMARENLSVEKINTYKTIVYIAVDNIYAGYLLISDKIKKDAIETIKGLKKLNVQQTIMLTGDNKSVGESVGNELNIDKIHTELLPQDKIEKLEEILSSKKDGNTIFVGDGINDAPVLKRADIGIAMGGIGSDAAIEAADIILMTDEPSKILDGIKIAKNTKKILTQNIVFSIAIKIGILLLGTIGIASLWFAVFADVGVALLAVLNSMRALKYR